MAMRDRIVLVLVVEIQETPFAVLPWAQLRQKNLPRVVRRQYGFQGQRDAGCVLCTPWQRPI